MNKVPSSFLASLFSTAPVQKITGVAAVCTPFTQPARRAVVRGAQLPAAHGKVALSRTTFLPDSGGQPTMQNHYTSFDLTPCTSAKARRLNQTHSSHNLPSTSVCLATILHIDAVLDILLVVPKSKPHQPGTSEMVTQALLSIKICPLAQVLASWVSQQMGK